MIRTSVSAILLLVFTCAAYAEGDTDLDRKIDELFIQASNPEAHHQYLVEPAREKLCEMGLKAVPRLVSKLATEDARERHALDDIFKRIGSPAVPALIEALDTTDLHQIRNAARALGEIGDKSATPALLPLFTHQKHTVRSTAVEAVGKCHDSSAVYNCISLLDDSAEPVRKSAAVALGRIADPGAVSPLIDALDDSHYSVRMSAVAAMESIGDDACTELVRRFDRLGDLAKYLAFEVWAECEFAPAGKLLERETHSQDTYARAFAIKALAAVDADTARKRIKKMLREETDLFVLSRIRAAEDLLHSKAR